MLKGLAEMKVGELAEATGVSVQAIRFYERRGLLPSPRRLQSGYRDYPAEAVRAVLRIKRMQEVGFTLRELERFLRLLEAGPGNHAGRRAYAEAKIRDIDAQVERLRSMREELSRRLLTCECCNAPPVNADDRS
jgi:MerR family transcriptional regulator, mercuric resistance operon regulatory protein